MDGQALNCRLRATYLFKMSTHLKPQSRGKFHGQGQQSSNRKRPGTFLKLTKIILVKIWILKDFKCHVVSKHLEIY